MEWRAFDLIEPLDAAGVILRGLAGSGSGGTSVPSHSATPSWMSQKAAMIQYFNLFGKKKQHGGS